MQERIEAMEYVKSLVRIVVVQWIWSGTEAVQRGEALHAPADCDAAR
ncbi:MAG: hypothetical protein HYX75_18260, partial [Acidobacteria bacterium]|nr:hypothetical protein [Acidobacteriota bacterium]